MSERKIAYAKASSELARLSDSDLIAQLEQATALGEGIGGPTYRLDVAGVPTFVKRIPLTELEQQNPMSTANIFDLPTHYQYGVGSAGFGAWRELRAHLMTTEWVVAGDVPQLPAALPLAGAVAGTAGDRQCLVARALGTQRPDRRPAPGD